MQRPMQPSPIAETSRDPRDRFSMLSFSFPGHRDPVPVELAGAEAGVFQPAAHLLAPLAHFFAADREAGADPGAGAGGGVVAFHAAEAADGVGDDRQHRLAGEVVSPV